MRFEHPHIIWLLLLAVPGLIAFFWWTAATKRRLILQFVQSRLLAQLTVGISRRRQKLRLALIVAAAACLIIALARPQWGFDWEEVRQRGLDIVVAIDTSRSMLADDVAPNRLARTKLAALDLKRLAQSDRIGLVAFAGSAFLQCPLSLDDDAFRQSIDALDTSIIPQGGTALSEAIQTAANAFKEKNDNYRVLVLFTDGENHDGHALETAKAAARDGMRIFTVGVGTAKGELLRVPDVKGRTEFIKDSEGNVVKSRLNEALLRQIAEAAQGFYMLLSGANTMEMLYERGLEPLPKSEFASRRMKRFHERFQWPLGAAILFLLAEMLIPERKRARRPETAAASAQAEWRKAIAIFLLVLCPGLLWSSPGRALKQYRDGKYESALSEYERALKKHPSDARLQFNAGTAAFQAGDYSQALDHLRSSLVTQDLALQQRAYYNLGNTQYRVGEDATELEQKIAAWEQAVSHYESAVKLDRQDSDAQYNLDVVKKKLEELKKQQQQQQEQQKQSDKNEQKDQDKQESDKQKSEEQKQSEQEQKDQQQREQQQKEQQQKEQQGSKDEQQQKPSPEEQQQQQPEKKSDEKSQEAQQSRPGEESQKPEGEPAQMQGAMAMTPRQAMQLLDAQKSDEKTMIFLPQNQERKNPNRVFKDW